jgi:hypothetical protein
MVSLKYDPCTGKQGSENQQRQPEDALAVKQVYAGFAHAFSKFADRADQVKVFCCLFLKSIR